MAAEETMRGLADDITRAARRLARQPGHTLAVVAVLSLGFGANAAVFSVADAVLLRPLPVEDPSSLVLFRWTSGPDPAVEYVTGEWWREGAAGRVTASSFSYPAFEAFVGPSKTLAATFGWAELRRASLNLDGEAEPVVGQLVSGGYYSGLGVPAVRGRTITPRDDRPGVGLSVVISDGYWQRRFGASDDVIGRTGILDGRPFTIVGVSARGFMGTLPLGRSADIAVPMRAWHPATGPHLSNAAWHWLHVMGRLRPGVTREQAQTEMAPRLAAVSAVRAGDQPALRVVDGSRGLTRTRQAQRDPLTLLGAATGLVLIMACVTAAGLLLARTAARRRELSVRLALGAGRWRIIAALFGEALFLVVLAGLAGITLASWAKDALAAGLMGPGAPRVAMDARVVALLGAVSFVTTLVAGLVPAFQASRSDLLSELRSGDRAATRMGSLHMLVGTQVALCFALLVLASMLLLTLRNLRSVETGFDADGVHLFKVHGTDWSSTQSRRLLERLQSLHGVRAAGISSSQLLDHATDRIRVTIEGRSLVTASAEFAHVNRVGGDFFDAMGIPVLSGRVLARGDEQGAPPVVLVNEAFARAYLPGEDPLGRIVNGAEVIGVTGDTRFGALRDPAPPVMFVPAFQQSGGSACFQVRTTASAMTLAPLLRRALAEVAPAATMYDLTTPRQQVESLTTRERLLSGLASTFGALMLLVSSLGVYGLMAHSLQRRTREIGVRIVLGARPGDILRLGLADGLRVTMGGLAAGLAVSLATTRLTVSLLYGVMPVDPSSIAAASLVLVGATTLACSAPARRAARMDPATTLRHD